MEIVDLNDVEEQLYQTFKKTLTEFAKTEANKDVYAIVFDCEVADQYVYLRYASESDYEKLLANYERYAHMYEPYGLKGLFGYKYNSIGDFNYIECDAANDILDQFRDRYDRVQRYEFDIFEDENAERPDVAFEYKGKTLKCDTPVKELLECENRLSEKLFSLFEDIIVNCIERLKADDLGLDKTADFIMFMCDHDESNEDFAEGVSRTVDKKLFERLTDYSDLS